MNVTVPQEHGRIVSNRRPVGVAAVVRKRDRRKRPVMGTGVEACVPDRKPSVGKQRNVVMKVFGRRHEGTAEMTEYEPEQR